MRQPDPRTRAATRPAAASLVLAMLLGAPESAPAASHAASRHRGDPAAPVVIGSWGDWHAATHRAAGALVCYAYSRAQASTPAIPGRGGVVLTVTERPGSPRDAVALSAGFAYPEGSRVELRAGAATLPFYTAGRSAFARSGAASVLAFHRAARAGGSVVAHSPAPDGAAVDDRFGLDGFDAAHDAVLKACPSRA